MFKNVMLHHVWSKSPLYAGINLTKKGIGDGFI